MPVIIAYMVLEAGSKDELVALVKEAIGKGWQPEGGIAVAHDRFYQAMVGH